MARNREPIKLQVNKRYPTFQLFAEVRNRGISQDLALKLCALEVMAWLRQRFVKFSPTPAELVVPEPQDYAALREGDIKSFHLDLGHTVDVLYVPEEGLWSFRLIEPDPGANLDSPKPRWPVVGRMFETNIAVRIGGERVQVGFRTICSEPEGHTEDCEVFRPVVVKNIANNRLLGLRQVVEIKPEPIIIDSNTALQRLQRLINSPDRALPILLITDPSLADIDSIFRDIHSSILGYNGKHIAATRLERTAVNSSPLQSQTRTNTIATAGAIAQSLIAFAHVAVCRDVQFIDLQQSLPMSGLSRGDWLIIYPDGSLQLIPSARAIIPSYANRIKEDLKLFPKRRAVDFHEVLFYTDAQIWAAVARQENLAEYGGQLELLEDECGRLRSKIRELEEENRDLKTSREDRGETNRRLRAEQDRREHAERQLRQIQAGLQDRDKLISRKYTEVEFYKRKSSDAARFPTTFEQIEDWLNKNFADYLVLHDRAVRGLRKIDRPIDITTLCEGIYFLFAHAKYLRKEITAEQRSLYQIDCSWNPSFSGKRAIELNQKDYEIVVTKANGKKEKRLLDDHIKHGIGNRLIRIYYLWDSEMEKIIIGSLPDHLPTTTDY